MSQYRLQFMSPQRVRQLSCGEVLNGNTTYHDQIDNDGIDSERIFGPVKHLSCQCGQLQGLQHRGKTCTHCRVTVLPQQDRWRRFGHIEFPIAIVHPLGLQPLSWLLDLSEEVVHSWVYEQTYWSIVPCDTGGFYLDLDTETHYTVVQRDERESGTYFSPLGLYELCQRIHWPATLTDTSGSDILIQRRSQWHQDWSVLFLWNILVMPPKLRQSYALSDDVEQTHDFTEHYRRILRRCQQIRVLYHAQLPTLMFLESYKLQREVHTLFFGKKEVRRYRPASLGILSHLQGKHGWIRNKIMGKRVDYSGRSVITSGPHLQLHEIGLPFEMAYELFKTHIIGDLRLRYRLSHREAERLHRRHDEIAHESLSRVMQGKVILLNRQPTLHKSGILAFYPRVTLGRFIYVHPLVMGPIGGDADGDTVSIHLPLTEEAQQEARETMLAKHNLLSLLNGEPQILPSHEMVLGLYYLSKKDETPPRQFQYDTPETAWPTLTLLLETREITWSTPLQFHRGIITTMGRLVLQKLFNIDEVTAPLTKSSIRTFIRSIYDTWGSEAFEKLPALLDTLKDISLAVVTQSGFSFGYWDIVPPTTKWSVLNEAVKEVHTYTNATERIQHWLSTFDTLRQTYTKEVDPENALYLMLSTGSRVSQEQADQLNLVKGLQTRGDGSILPHPVLHSLRDGLSPHEYFQSCSGARKGMADKKNVTPLGGYYCQKLVHLLRDMTITISDCGSSDQPRSVISCRTPAPGVCQACYGIDASTQALVALGTHVGVRTAQSLSEVGTQSAMKQKHTSGAVTGIRDPLGVYAMSPGKYTVTVDPTITTLVTVMHHTNGETYHFSLLHGSLHIAHNQEIERGALLFLFHTDVKNKHVSEMIKSLLAHIELSTPRIQSYIIEEQRQYFQYRVERMKYVLTLDGKDIGSLPLHVPIHIPSGSWVTQGTVLNAGDIHYRGMKNFDLATQLFLQHYHALYEGIRVNPVHCELVWRGLTQLVKKNDGSYGFLYRDSGERQILGVTQTIKCYPSWLKKLAYGYVKENLTHDAFCGSLSQDVITEKIMQGLPIHK